MAPEQIRGETHWLIRGPISGHSESSCTRRLRVACLSQERTCAEVRDEILHRNPRPLRQVAAELRRPWKPLSCAASQSNRRTGMPRPKPAARSAKIEPARNATWSAGRDCREPDSVRRPSAEHSSVWRNRTGPSRPVKRLLHDRQTRWTCRLLHDQTGKMDVLVWDAQNPARRGLSIPR